eukprot:403358462
MRDKKLRSITDNDSQIKSDQMAHQKYSAFEKMVGQSDLTKDLRDKFGMTLYIPNKTFSQDQETQNQDPNGRFKQSNLNSRLNGVRYQQLQDQIDIQDFAQRLKIKSNQKYLKPQQSIETKNVLKARLSLGYSKRLLSKKMESQSNTNSSVLSLNKADFGKFSGNEESQGEGVISSGKFVINSQDSQRSFFERTKDQLQLSNSNIKIEIKPMLPIKIRRIDFSQSNLGNVEAQNKDYLRDLIQKRILKYRETDNKIRRNLLLKQSHHPNQQNSLFNRKTRNSLINVTFRNQKQSSQLMDNIKVQEKTYESAYLQLQDIGVGQSPPYPENYASQFFPKNKRNSKNEDESMFSKYSQRLISQESQAILSQKRSTEMRRSRDLKQRRVILSIRVQRNNFKDVNLIFNNPINSQLDKNFELKAQPKKLTQLNKTQYNENFNGTKKDGIGSSIMNNKRNYMKAINSKISMAQMKRIFTAKTQKNQNFNTDL